VPAWRSGKSFVDLPLLAKITDMGYNRLEFAHAQNDQLIYWREGQVVGRRLLVLQKI